MQLAAKHALWCETGSGTMVELAMTETTGLKIKFVFRATEGGSVVTIAWGDGATTTVTKLTGDPSATHTYKTFGNYRVLFKGIRCLGLRWLDGQTQYSYDAAVISVVDYAKQLTGSTSAAFKKAVNLKRFIAPNCGWMGQRDFALCTSLEEVQIGKSAICYDGTYQNCSKLKKYTTEATGCCWSYVWQGCTALEELRLGAVSQFATKDFDNTPNLKDIYIANHTVEEILQKAPRNNITAGYGAKFPWGATATCRFHGTDGIVLGSGVRIS